MKPILIHISGLPCSGKSHVRKQLEDIFNFEVIDIENVWRDVFESPRYSREEGEIVFGAFLRRISDSLADCRSIIAESVLASESRFYRLAGLATQCNANCFFILVEAQLDVLKERLRSRRAHDGNAITDESFEDLRRRFSTGGLVNLVVDSTHGVEAQEILSLRALIHGTTIYSGQNP